MLPPPVPGERVEIEPGLVGWIAGQGEPLLLVHSVNAAASAAEVRPVFEHAAKRRRVVAIDLPGFGSSDRSDRRYTPRLMTDALHAVSAWLRRQHGERPIDALAVSLGCEFLARAAAEQPSHWGRLSLVSPTGFNGGKVRREVTGSTLAVPGLLPALKLPLWSQPLFSGLTRPSVVRYFLRKTWGSPDIDPAMADYAIRTAREPGARFAPLAFLSGGLFSADIHAVYERLVQSVWMGHGTRGDFTDYRGKALVEGRPNWRITVYNSGALPYFERGNRFFADFDQFFA